MLNKKAPQFQKLKEFLSPKDKYLVLYFYPKDDTPGCTAEACSLRDNFSSLKKNNIKIIGVSPNSMTSHEKFKTKYNLPFKLLADEDKSLAKAFNVWKEKSMYGRKYMGIVRTTFIINSEGKIIKIIDKVDTKNHAQQILEELN